MLSYVHSMNIYNLSLFKKINKKKKKKTKIQRRTKLKLMKKLKIYRSAKIIELSDYKLLI